MSAYGFYLTPSNHLETNTRTEKTNYTPKKTLFKTTDTPPDYMKHQYERPVTHKYSPYKAEGVNGKFQVPYQSKPQMNYDVRLYNSNHVPIPKYNPEKVPTHRVPPENPPFHFTPCKQSKNRKGSENNIAFTNKLTSHFECKQGSPSLLTQKQRRGSCNNLFLDLQYKKPRLSMIDQPTELEPIIEKKTDKIRRGFTENFNFKMEQSYGDQETNSSDILKVPKKENIHANSQHQHKDSLQKGDMTKRKERKHSDNQCTRKAPAFLTNGRDIERRYSLVPHKKWTIERFKIVKELGKGAYGRVVLALERETHFACAIKILSKKDLQEENMIEQFIRELKIQCYFNHPNIIKVYGFFDDLLHFYVVMECALDKRLSDQLESKKMGEAESAGVFYQLCSAVGSLHTDSVIHRDLKPQNIMIHEGVIKVCDFGWSVYRGSQLRTTFCGTPLYLCPQILVGDSYDQSVDVWALGIILYEMVIGGNPFSIKQAKDLVNILHESIDWSSKTLSPQLRQILQACLRKKGQDRPSVKWLLGREWVRRRRPQQCSRFSVKNDNENKN